MNFSFSRILALSILGIGAGLGSAYAGQAEFHLPFEAHWGSMTMTPGDYRLTLPEAATPIAVFYLHGQSKAGLEMAGRYELGQSGGKSYLKFVNVDGEYFVKQFISGTTGKTFSFQVPKATHRQQISEERVLSFDNTGTK
jgi:hypothetical protein